jgi:DNA-directed RNA polymerase I and III subunit RPAC2
MEETPKLRIVATTPQSCTFVIHDEDHTLGNSLRHVLSRNPKSDFCGYSVPHPSEPFVNIRLQTHSVPAADVFQEGLKTLTSITEHILHTFNAAVESSGKAMET